MRDEEESPFDQPMKDYIVYFVRDGKEEKSGKVCVDDGSQYIQVSVDSERVDKKTRIMAVDRDEVYLIPGIAERPKQGDDDSGERPVTLLQGDPGHVCMKGQYVQFHFDGDKEWGVVTKDLALESGTYVVSMQDERGQVSLTINQSRVLKFQREKPTAVDYAA